MANDLDPKPPARRDLRTRYVVVTPARDEAEHLGNTIASMIAQTVLPSQWVIVDDGSSDATPDLIDDAAAHHPWIVGLRLEDRGHRQAGGGVVAAFNAGADALTVEYDFIVKLDADLQFGPDYFERCLAAFKADEQLGIAGGTVRTVTNRKAIVEDHPRFHVRGATKIYRADTYRAIGGLRPVAGWDTIDEVIASRLGWATETLGIPIEQLRVTGGAAGQWSNWVKNGHAAYLAGYHPLFLLARAVKRLVQRPLLVASAGLAWGYARDWISRTPRAVDSDTQAFVRTQQMRRLMGRPSVWR